MASWEEVAEPIFREAIEKGGHQLTIMNPGAGKRNSLRRRKRLSTMLSF